MTIHKNIKKIIKFGIGGALFVWLTYSLYIQIAQQENLQENFAAIFTEWTTPKIVGMIAVILLMLLNWSIESIKWQMLLKHTERITFVQSFQSVLTGLAVSVVTPNRIGEYVGRILFLKNTNKLKGISITIIGSFAQILVTSLFGILGLLFYLYAVDQSGWLYFLLASSILIALVMTYLLFNLDKVVEWCQSISFLKKISVYIAVIKRYERKTLYKLIFYAVGRYCVYSLQFYILLFVTHAAFLPIQTFAGIWLLFWIIAVVPSFVIADVSVRGQTAVTFLAFVSTNTLAIVTASVLLWLINLIIPALVGCFFIFRIKLFDNE